MNERKLNPLDSVITHDFKNNGKELCQKFLAEASTVIFNKETEFRLALICFLAKGHLLIEDVPGVGKTTFVKTVAKLLGLQFGRLQFTNDLLPSDIIGNAIYDKDKKAFQFYKGPLFSEAILIDELNRATPKTQSALLQAMEERQVTIDGQTYDLPQNFFIAATQNPRHQVGTFSLPESQLDRFTMRIKLGYPDAEAEKKLLLSTAPADRLERLKPVFTETDLKNIFLYIKQVFISDEIASYVHNLLNESRQNRKDIVALSPRTGMSLIAAARVNAFLEGRSMVLPEDVQAVAVAVINHRISHVTATFEMTLKLSKELVSAVEIK